MSNIIPHQIYSIKLGFTRTLSGDLPEKISMALEEKVNSVFLNNKESTDGDNWEVTLTTIGKPDIGDIVEYIEEVIPGIVDKHSIVVEKVPEIDWLQQVHDNFPPITIGRFFVYGSHYTGEFPKRLIPLQIDAATAFGSGEHETTKGCIEAFEYLFKHELTFDNALDMGCGSGILGIALAKIWPDIKVAAVDIDPESIVVTERHAQTNGVLDKITTEAGDGYNSPLVSKTAPYDIIAANILANPLISMAPDLYKNLKEGGYCVLAGLLSRQKDAVIKAHEEQGLKLIHVKPEGEWQIIIMQK